MNDYQMRFLADDHQRELRAEAERARLARQAHLGQRAAASKAPGDGPQPRHGWLRLGSLLARFTA